MINREGTFYGQCSEICGILHSSMPVVIESVSIEKFVSWLLASWIAPFKLVKSNIAFKRLGVIMVVFYDLLQKCLTRAFNSLQWLFNSPPKPNVYVNLS